MPPSREASVPAVWADFYEETHIPAAVRVVNTLRVTGHTGETADGTFSDDGEEQIRQVFRNITLTLAEAEASWSDVVEINSYHIGLLSQAEALLKVAAEFLGDPSSVDRRWGNRTHPPRGVGRDQLHGCGPH